MKELIKSSLSATSKATTQLTNSSADCTTEVKADEK